MNSLDKKKSNETKLGVDGMTCDSCAVHVDNGFVEFGSPDYIYESTLSHNLSMMSRPYSEGELAGLLDKKDQHALKSKFRQECRINCEGYEGETESIL